MEKGDLVKQIFSITGGLACHPMWQAKRTYLPSLVRYPKLYLGAWQREGVYGVDENNALLVHLKQSEK